MVYLFIEHILRSGSLLLDFIAFLSFQAIPAGDQANWTTSHGISCWAWPSRIFPGLFENAETKMVA